MPNITTEETEKAEEQCDQSSESELPFPHGGEVLPYGACFLLPTAELVFCSAAPRVGRFPQASM